MLDFNEDVVSCFQQFSTNPSEQKHESSFTQVSKQLVQIISKIKISVLQNFFFNLISLPFQSRHLMKYYR